MADIKKQWKEMVEKLLPEIRQVLLDFGFKLDEIQPDLIGEKFLMKTEKFVLRGRNIRSSQKVIIKISDTSAGKKDIETEYKAGQYLASLSFSIESIRTPKVLCFGEKEKWMFLISEFLEQKEIYTKMPLEDQYYIALRAFALMEEFQVTTHEHKKEILGKFKLLTSKDYLKKFKVFQKNINTILNDLHVRKVLVDAENQLSSHNKIIDMFSPFMVHEDFVPHNFCIKDNILYFLDAEAVQFGNKYESWARFLNFMIFHSPDLEKKLTQYVKAKGSEEYQSLRLMRILKAVQLLNYYAENLGKTIGNENMLTRKRLEFWKQIVEHLLVNQELHQSFIEEYRNARDTLRSEEEKERQKLSKIS